MAERKGLLLPLLLMIEIRCHMSTRSCSVPALSQQQCQAWVSRDIHQVYGIWYKKKRNKLNQLNFNTSILNCFVFTCGMWMYSCVCTNSARISDQGALGKPISISLVQRLQVCATKPGFVHGFWRSNSYHHTSMTASSLHSEPFPKPLQCLSFPLHFPLVCSQVIEVVTS